MIETGEVEKISKFIGSLTQQNEQLYKSLLSLAYYWRGTFSMDDILTRSPNERELMVTFLNERFKDAGEMIKNGVSVFI